MLPKQPDADEQLLRNLLNQPPVPDAAPLQAADFDEQFLSALLSQIPAQWEAPMPATGQPPKASGRRSAVGGQSLVPGSPWSLIRSPWLMYFGLTLLVIVVLVGMYIFGSAALAMITIRRNIQAMQLPTPALVSTVPQHTPSRSILTATQPAATWAPPGAVVGFAPVDATEAARPPHTVATPSATTRPTLTPLPPERVVTPEVLPSLAAPDPIRTPAQSPLLMFPPRAVISPREEPPPPGAPITILLLGSDRRPDETGPSRSDAIMIARVDPERQRIALLSLPRDLIVEIPGYGSARINAASVYGAYGSDSGDGAELARSTVSNLLGVPIDFVALINFDGFISAIDAIGGITVNVERELYDAQYPTMDYGYTVAHFLPGPQHMDGATALMYSRIRHMDSDFERMRRQQQVMLGILDRVQEQNSLEQLHSIAAVTTALRGYVQTDLPEERMVSLAWAFRNISPAAIERYTLDGSMVSMYVIPGDPYAQLAVPGAIEFLVQQLMNGPAQ